MSIEKVAVMGAGTMGNGIAQVAAAAGYDVRPERTTGSGALTLDDAEAIRKGAIAKGITTLKDATQIFDRLGMRVVELVESDAK